MSILSKLPLDMLAGIWGSLADFLADMFAGMGPKHQEAAQQAKAELDQIAAERNALKTAFDTLVNRDVENQKKIIVAQNDNAASQIRVKSLEDHIGALNETISTLTGKVQDLENQKAALVGQSDDIALHSI